MKKLYFVGGGISIGHHLTREALDVLEDADSVLSICGETSALTKILARKDEPVDVSHLYVDGDIDERNYSRLASYITSELSKFNSVAVVLSGHPTVGVSWTRGIAAEVGSNCTVRYIEGISSLTSMFHLLERDPLDNGTIVVDVNRLLLFQNQLDPCLDLYIYHVCSIATLRTHLGAPATHSKWSLLRSFLLQKYSLDQEVLMLTCGNIAKNEQRVIRGNVEHLERLADDVDFSSTLFIPSQAKPSVNREFIFALLHDED